MVDIRNMYDWSSNKRSGTIGVGPLAGAVVNFNNQWFDTLTPEWLLVRSTVVVLLPGRRGLVPYQH